MEGTQTAIEKLRKERDELWAVVNTDKYKNVRTVELEKEKIEKQKHDIEASLKETREEVSKVVMRVQELEGSLAERDFEREKYREREVAREKLL